MSLENKENIDVVDQIVDAADTCVHVNIFAVRTHSRNPHRKAPLGVLEQTCLVLYIGTGLINHIESAIERAAGTGKRPHRLAIVANGTGIEVEGHEDLRPALIKPQDHLHADAPDHKCD